MFRKKLLALLLAAAMALSLLAGCGSGQQSAAQALLKLLDGQYQNVSVEMDKDLEADLRRVLRENETDDEAAIRGALETVLGSTITFRNLRDGQQGDIAFDLVFYAGSDPDKAAQAAYTQWNPVFSTLPGDGKYTAGLALVETGSGCFALVKATVEKAGTVDKPDDDEPDEPEPDKGYTVSEDGKTYEVYNADGLMAWNDAVQKNLSLNCTLTGKIDLTGKEWTPIGTSSSSYTGTFDGGNYTITGLKITGNDQYAGLIGYLDFGGTVQNVVLEDVKIESDNSSGCVGGVVGYNWDGTIENCSVSGSVSGSNVGGVVGYQCGGSITGCSSSATVKGTERAGGVVGVTNGGATTIIACYTTGDVTLGSNGISAGGVVGQNNGTITACYHATGTVMGGTAGGVVGNNYNEGTVTACYWSGSVKDEDGKETNAGIGSGSGDATQVEGDWNAAMAAMNTALESAGSKWRYELTSGLPTLTQK